MALALSQLNATHKKGPYCFLYIYIFKGDSKNTRTTSSTYLNRFHTLFEYFHCWLWNSKCRSGATLQKSLVGLMQSFQSCNCGSEFCNYGLKCNFGWKCCNYGWRWYLTQQLYPWLWTSYSSHCAIVSRVNRINKTIGCKQKTKRWKKK